MLKLSGLGVFVLALVAGCGGGDPSNVASEGSAARVSSLAVAAPEVRSLLAAVPSTTPARKAIFRFFNTSTEAHFFTINAPERNQIIATLPQFRFEDQAYYAMPTAAPNYLPVYRFYNTQTLAHFFTIDEGEKNTVLASYPFYRFEGTAWHATTDSQLAASTGALPVYRFFNFKTSTHFYTINEAERVEVQTRYPTQFRFEGLAYYAWTDTQQPVALISPAAAGIAGLPVSLDGTSSSDPDGDTLTYQWRLVAAPGGSAATLLSSTASVASLLPDMPGTYSVQLVVSDGFKASEPVIREVQVMAAPLPNNAPVAVAGAAQTVDQGATVNLNGTGSSDLDGNPLTYFWTLATKPAGSAAVLTNATSATPSFRADISGDYLVRLVVNDGQINSPPSTVNITVAGVQLYEISSFSGESAVSLPYSASASVSSSSTCVGGACPTDAQAAQFRLQAKGKAFTVTNLSAVNSTTGSSIVASFSGLSNNQVILAGQAVPFTLRSQFTRGQTVDLSYRFTILESGQTFNYRILLRTN